MSYKSIMDGPLYSVKDVAALIARGSADQPARLIRQIRHWTANDLLIPVGGKNTGTGVSRMYDVTGVRCAAILLELSRYGITVGQLEGFAEWAAMLSGSNEWLAAFTGEQDVFLSMSWEADEEGGGIWEIGAGKPKWDALRLQTVPDRVTLADGRETLLQPLDLTSSIVINLTKILDRLAL